MSTVVEIPLSAAISVATTWLVTLLSAVLYIERRLNSKMSFEYHEKICAKTNADLANKLETFNTVAVAAVEAAASRSTEDRLRQEKTAERIFDQLSKATVRMAHMDTSLAVLEAVAPDKARKVLAARRASRAPPDERN